MLLKGLKESKCKVRNNTFVLIGAAGSGKTSVMAVMMGEDPPETRSSTGCATCPVRGMTTTRMSKSGCVWNRVPYSQLSRQLATAAVKVVAVRRAGNMLCIQVEDGDTESSSSSPQSSGHPSQTQEGQNLVASGTTPTGSATHKEPYTQASQIPSDIVEELGSMFEGGLIDGSAELLDMDWISILDSGGQPAFHELLPFFVHDPSAALFTFKLSEALSSYYMVTYYKEGKPVGKPYRSSLNNEQTLSTCMRTIPSQVSQGGTGGVEGKESMEVEKEGTTDTVGMKEEKGKVDREMRKTTKYAFIGTHRDEESRCTDETRADKEKKIEAMIPASVRPHVLRCGSSFLQSIQRSQRKTTRKPFHSFAVSWWISLQQNGRRFPLHSTP